ncbi:hypothetical protein FHY30_001845 [Xanthomonas arboricola]|uniref:hypothetical protein n=1 Tax=Xanthomonas campestris TaxID=339 RepID=UPI00128FFF09|nr:hypothetical protein [Xanthomonas campestris]MCW2003090.1 hypothetical protein [Xanthomonas campestris]
MTHQPIETVLTADFLTAALIELTETGFITDEHSFTPYRETINVHFSAIQDALEQRGFKSNLLPGYLNHPKAGYAYYVYDAEKFRTRQAAEIAINLWLTKRYSD